MGEPRAGSDPATGPGAYGSGPGPPGGPASGRSGGAAQDGVEAGDHGPTVHSGHTDGGDVDRSALDDGPYGRREEGGQLAGSDGGRARHSEPDESVHGGREPAVAPAEVLQVAESVAPPVGLQQ